MNETLVTTLGFIAAALTTGSWLPQAWKTIKSRSAEDFSWMYLLAFTSGVTCWAIYGFLKKDMAVIAANVVTFALLIPVIVVKLREKRRADS